MVHIAGSVVERMLTAPVLLPPLLCRGQGPPHTGGQMDDPWANRVHPTHWDWTHSTQVKDAEKLEADMWLDCVLLYHKNFVFTINLILCLLPSPLPTSVSLSSTPSPLSYFWVHLPERQHPWIRMKGSMSVMFRLDRYIHTTPVFNILSMFILKWSCKLTGWLPILDRK